MGSSPDVQDHWYRWPFFGGAIGIVAVAYRSPRSQWHSYNAIKSLQQSGDTIRVGDRAERGPRPSAFS